MSRKALMLLALGFVVLGGTAAYWNWHGLDSQRQTAFQKQADEAGEAAGRTQGPPRRQHIADGSPELLPLAESVRPNIVTYKQGKPLWELSHNELHEHVDDLRALADAGWGQAVFPLVRLVSSCLGTQPVRTEQELRDQARSMRANSLDNQGDLPDDEVQRRVALADRWLEYQLQESSRRRVACAAVTAADEDRIIDWLELALEQRHPEFLAGYLRWGLLPADNAWKIRHAERLADFNRRFEAAYLDGVYAGERKMLDLTWKLYATRTVLPEPDRFKAFAFNHAADLAARESTGMTREYMDSYRLEAIELNAAQVDDARAEGERIYERCCAEARMPK
ncbi:MAG: hypothetical protein ACNA7J_14275 [Wenzhouxiangella sp.]